ncbi:hypothetical protein ACIBCA_08095 [Kitasatospora sp. NPDC051170]|uniref:hypothetical protein n=1 Tax=Kitasatospora sp. NPDC051170 TaxID=3364056 RepID=UPI003793EB93
MRIEDRRTALEVTLYRGGWADVGYLAAHWEQMPPEDELGGPVPANDITDDVDFGARLSGWVEKVFGV